MKVSLLSFLSKPVLLDFKGSGHKTNRLAILP